jgi:hypothetical protein
MGRYTNTVPQIIGFVNGVFTPIVGAKKFFFEPGTVTPKTIYSDADLTLTRANPVLSDASGRYSDDVFLDGIYSEEQQDNSGTPSGYDGATLWTKDPVGEIIAGQFEAWISSSIYDIPEIVQGSDDEYYRSLTDGNQGNDPTSSAANWELLRFGRVWNTNVTYGLGDSAYGSDGFLYISIAATNLANDPTSDPTKWRHGTRHAQAADATGTVDAITATFSPVIPSLINGYEVRVRASGANTITNPTFAPDGLTAKTIVMHGDNALVPGGINGADHELILRFNSSNDNWELLNPAKSRLVASDEVTGSATTTIDFTGLDMNAHGGRYNIEVSFIEGASLVTAINLYVNNDTTDTNYYVQQISVNDTTVTGSRTNLPSMVQSAADNEVLANAYIGLANGYPHVLVSYASGAASAVLLIDRVIKKTGTVSNITQLTFTATQTDGLGVGTTIKIYRTDT